MAVNDNPTLSLCMIVKNEEHFLPKCLSSVQDVVDEIIIVDTGSEDKTVEIAESFGAKVYHHPWEGDFSKARNQSLQYATSDWILVIDADEELDPNDKILLKNALKSDSYDVIFCAVLSSSPHGVSKNYSHRIFRQGKAHYEGIVHNQLVHNSAWLHTNIRIYHHGYNLTDEQMQAKFKRTSALLLKQLEEKPDNAFAYQNYIRILRVQHKYRKAVEFGTRAFKVCSETMNDLHFQMIANDTAYSLISLKQFDKAEVLIHKVLQKNPRNLDVVFAHALVLQGLQKYREAIEEFNRFIKLNREQKKNPQHTLVLIDSFDFDHRALGNISDCYYYLGEYENARTALEKAIVLRDDIPVYYTAFARLLLELNDPEKAKNLLLDYEKHKPLEPVFYEKWAGIALKYGDFGNPIDILKRGLEKFPNDVHIMNLLATQLVNKDQHQAVELWKRILELQPNHQGAHVGIATISAVNDEKGNFVHHVEYIIRYSDDYQIMKKIAGSAIKFELYDLAIECYTKYLHYDPQNIDVLIDIATCYAKSGRYDVALTGYKNVLKLDPYNSRVLQNLQVLQNILEQQQSS